MSRAPDLSAFPIPRKGGARPIVGDETDEARGEGGGPHPPAVSPASGAGPQPEREPEAEPVSASRAPATSRTAGSGAPIARSAAAIRPPAPPPQTYGQTVATTVKLDENRYLRLVEAGKPGPGRLKRRTIQDMLIEALDEWFERRRL